MDVEAYIKIVCTYLSAMAGLILIAYTVVPQAINGLSDQQAKRVSQKFEIFLVGTAAASAVVFLFGATYHPDAPRWGYFAISAICVVLSCVVLYVVFRKDNDHPRDLRFTDKESAANNAIYAGASIVVLQIIALAADNWEKVQKATFMIAN